MHGTILICWRLWPCLDCSLFCQSSYRWGAGRLVTLGSFGTFLSTLPSSPEKKKKKKGGVCLVFWHIVYHTHHFWFAYLRCGLPKCHDMLLNIPVRVQDSRCMGLRSVSWDNTIPACVRLTVCSSTSSRVNSSFQYAHLWWLFRHVRVLHVIMNGFCKPQAADSAGYYPGFLAWAISGGETHPKRGTPEAGGRPAPRYDSGVLQDPLPHSKS
jgi:hypothetical protein